MKVDIRTSSPLFSTSTRARSLAGLLLLHAIACVSTAEAAWFDRTEDGIMGTRIAVELWADDKRQADQALDSVFNEMRRIDQSMSTYKPESEVSRVNATAAERPVVISSELFELLTTAVEYSRITGGAFDITYASVGFMYDFRSRIKPTDKDIAAALPTVNYRFIELDKAKSTVHFAKPGVRIDLGGIAKGHAVDRGIALLQGFKIEHASVTAGGDTRIIGDRMGAPWVVGIRHPDDKTRVIARIPLVDTAISTSGDYERYFDEKGVRYHHIIDPASGHSASKVRSATVIAATATRTDGLSKTAFVLGAEKAIEIYDRLGDVDAILVTPEGKVLYTKGLEAP
ncbi:MAG: FAD:protein FMN transferase [Steroidobacteraceae bacterium]